MFKYLHGNSTVSSLHDGETKIRDLKPNDLILCNNLDNNTAEVYLKPVLELSTFSYNNWYKIILSNDEEYIFDRDTLLTNNKKFNDLDTMERIDVLGEDLYISTIKQYNKTSKAYILTIEESFNILYLNNLGILNE